MIAVTYTGTDGSLWDLRQIAQDGQSVFLTDGGLQGLGMPDFEYFTQSGPLTVGQRMTGYRSQSRKVYLPVMVGVNLPEEQFLALSRRWWRACAPGEYGTLTATTSDGLARSIRIRFQDDGGSALEDDPTEVGSEVLSLTFMADYPFWSSPLVRSTYQNDPGVDFYGGSALATPFYISSSNRVVDATIQNTGDVAAWGVYTLRGPLDPWSIRVNGGNVGSYPLNTGDVLVIDSNPTAQTAILTRANGTVADVTADLPNIDWRPIPKGQSVPLQLTFTGGGSIDVDLPALYYRGY